MEEKRDGPPAYNQAPYMDNPNAGAQQHPAQPYAGQSQYPGQYPGQFAPQPGYGQYPAGAATVAIQPGTVIINRTPLANPPPDHLIYSILVTIFCCWPIGIFAILKAIETREASNHGDIDTALHRSREAKRFATWSLIAGIVLVSVSVIITIIYVVVVVVAATASVNSNLDDHDSSY